MSQPNLGALRAVADRLDGLGMEYAFLGGSIVTLLLDNPELSHARPTDDVDVIIEMATTLRYSDIEAKLRDLKFDHDIREGAPRCRWVLGKPTKRISYKFLPTAKRLLREGVVELSAAGLI